MMQWSDQPKETYYTSKKDAYGNYYDVVEGSAVATFYY
jgi:hypothetical protein